jgi:hypothetical protein
MVIRLTCPSPVWYCTKGRNDEAKKALRRLIGNVDGYDFDHEYSVIQYETRKSKELAEATGTSDWKALRSKVNLVRCIVATLPFTFQNVCGVPLMFGYTVYFFQLAGVKDPFLGNLIKQLVLVVGILTSFYTVDRVGRRALVLYGGSAMCIINTVVGGLGFMKQNNASGIALVFLCSLWAFVYANSLAPIGKSIKAFLVPQNVCTDRKQAGLVSLRHRALGFGQRQHRSPLPYSISPAYCSTTPCP